MIQILLILYISKYKKRESKMGRYEELFGKIETVNIQ